MKPIGKTYLIKCSAKPSVEMNNGIYVPTNFDVDEVNDIFYFGEIVSYGNGFSKDEIEKLLPLGTKVFFEFKDKRGIKIVLGKNSYYIKEEDQILGYINDEEC